MTTLYIHIPFCDKKCFYCSFVVSIGQNKRINDYLDCLKKEAKSYQGTLIESIYIGGGTPSLLSSEQLENLFAMIHQNFSFKENVEITLEANPEGMSLDKVKVLKQLGVNRLSLGVQSLNNEYLKYLGRIHNRDKALEVIQMIQSVGFKNINLDLIYGFENQTEQELREDVTAIASLGSQHLSLYSLMVEEHSRFYTKGVSLKEDKIQANQYTLVCDVLQNHGFHQYEVSNFAKPSFESKHNINYWQKGNYIGLGVGAHSFLNKKRFFNADRLLDYMKQIKDGESAIKESETLTDHDCFKEYILFGLRMNQGVSIEEAQKKFGCVLTVEEKQYIHALINEGYLYFEGSNLKTHLKGRMVLDEICAKLI